MSCLIFFTFLLTLSIEWKKNQRMLSVFCILEFTEISFVAYFLISGFDVFLKPEDTF